MTHKPSLMTVVTWAFVIFNLFIWLIGCSFLSVGIWLVTSHQNSKSTLAPGFSYLNATYVVFATGLMSVIIGSLGCLGVVTKNRCLLLAYFVLVLLLFALEIIIISMVYHYQNEISNSVRAELVYGIKSLYPQMGAYDSFGLRTEWRSIQLKLKCCGVNDYRDWFESNSWPGKRWVPESCCRWPQTGCGTEYSPAAWHNRGCFEEMVYVLQQNYYIFGVLAVSLGVMQILAMVVAIVLRRHLKTLRRTAEQRRPKRDEL